MSAAVLVHSRCTAVSGPSAGQPSRVRVGAIVLKRDFEGRAAQFCRPLHHAMTLNALQPRFPRQ